METKTESGYLNVTVSGAFARNSLLCVNTSTGKYDLAQEATAAALIVGHLTEESFADGDKRVVKLLNAPGTHIGYSSEAIALTNTLKADDGGKVGTESGSGAAVGVPLEAVGADEFFEYRPIVAG